jgi:hypothetical protein
MRSDARRVSARAVAAIAVGLVACAVALVVFSDRLQRDVAIAKLGAEVASTAEGATIDLADAFDLDWDRAAILDAYEPGGSANVLLGFRAYGEHDELTVSDEAQWIVFARNGRVVADFLIPTARSSFSFAVPSVSLTPEDAVFTVHRRDRTAVLVK